MRLGQGKIMSTAHSTNNTNTLELDQSQQHIAQQHTKKRRAIIAALLTLVIVLSTCFGVWWTAGDGSNIMANLIKPAAKPANVAARNATVSFAYRSAPHFLAPSTLNTTNTNNTNATTSTDSTDNADNTSSTTDRANTTSTVTTGDHKGNVNYSPISLWMALSMLEQGAGGQTRAQMTKLLSDPNALVSALGSDDYQSLLRAVNGRYSGSQSEMDMHNSVWIDDDYQLTDSFRSMSKDAFHADIQSLQFNNAAATRMEDWITKHVHGMLKPSLKLNNDTMLSVINTVYADGRWESPFDPEFTEEDTFHGTNGDNTVPMMEQTFNSMVWTHDENDTWQRVSIPFDNGGALTILLPQDGHFDEIAGSEEKLLWAMSTCLNRGENGTTAGGYACAADSAAGMGVSAEPMTVFVRMPRFSINNTFASDDIRAILESLGMTDAFDATKADFSTMVERRSSSENVFLSQIVQGTTIEVNEHGAKASAFTHASIDSAGAPDEEIAEFIVDRPFIYEYDTPDGVPLFIGAVRNL